MRHFDKGNYFHELCHVYYRLIRDIGIKPGSAIAEAMMMERIREDLRNLSQDNIDVFHIITAKFMRFLKEQSPIIDRGIVVEGVEEELEVPVELPSGRIISLYGYLDLRYSIGSYHAIRDHKTGEKPWSGEDVGLSNQLLHYDAAVFLMTGLNYSVEINFVNTHEYAKKIPSFEEVFTWEGAPHSAREIQVYLDQTCQLIDEMLDSKPTPHYDERVCKYCPYKTPCMMERRGIDSTPILETNYAPRDETPRERTFISKDTDGNDPN